MSKQTENNSEINQFWNAVQNGDVNKVKEFLNKGIELDIQNMFGQNALHVACSSGHLDMVKFLVLEKKMDVNISTRDNDDDEAAVHKGQPALDWAVRNSNWEVAKFLIEQGANLETLKQGDNTILIFVSKISDENTQDRQNLAMTILDKMAPEDIIKDCKSLLNMLKKSSVTKEDPNQRALGFLLPLVSERIFDNFEINGDVLLRADGDNFTTEQKKEFLSVCKVCQKMGIAQTELKNSLPNTSVSRASVYYPVVQEGAKAQVI